MKYKRKDNNHNHIVKDLSFIPGLSVVDISSFGKGLGDILVGFNNHNFLFEIKNPGNSWKLTPSEKSFHLSFNGQIDVVSSVEQIIYIINARSNVKITFS